MDLVVYIFLAIFVIDVTYDWYNIEKRGRQIKHGLETIIAVAAYVLALVLLVVFKEITALEAFAVAIVFPAIRWFGHDIALNLLRGLPLKYTGTDQSSATTDKILNVLVAWGIPSWFARAVAIALSFVLQSVLSGVITF